MIYLDNSATTKPYNEVVETYAKVATTYFGNPSSLHSLGMQAEGLMLESRNRIAGLLGVKVNEIIFTSGGTEGNNLAIKGTAYARKKRGKHLITTVIEHPSVHETFSQLEQEGYEVTYLPVDHEGRVNVEQVVSAIRPDTILVSIIHVNNEVGTVQPIEEIGKRLKEYQNVYFHVDHVQGISKVPLSFHQANIDLCTCSAHKFHGMKGTGFLFVREGVRLASLLHGGEQENRFRAGTENVAGIVAMAKALRLVKDQENTKYAQLYELREQFVRELRKIDGVVLNSPMAKAASHIVNFSIPGAKPEVVVQSLTTKKIYVSTKSACSSKLSAPSHVLMAMGLGEERAASGVRVSFSYETTAAELKCLLQELHSLIPELLEVVR
ncbi:cysteine desulfurase family protein [Halalkalibacter nanhaiisediminis]|uniref:Cysteine desulfurase n=1 Tax=Halalkalibacter nanhaiisediminis TaxID=688079 RepID=A0A562QJV6_9BACI|nr:cysteine desulfurase family protein [Halalkalibacter nanhaiisediminis]TWI56953.1 cysteine desulfurase [Halalkalibacter nanhaiisediminis]